MICATTFVSPWALAALVTFMCLFVADPWLWVVADGISTFGRESSCPLLFAMGLRYCRKFFILLLIGLSGETCPFTGGQEEDLLSIVPNFLTLADGLILQA
jgi:hypothetical protein